MWCRRPVPPCPQQVGRLVSCARRLRVLLADCCAWFVERDCERRQLNETWGINTELPQNLVAIVDRVYVSCGWPAAVGLEPLW